MNVMKQCDEIRVEISEVSTISDFSLAVDKLQVLAYNNRANKDVVNLIELALKKCDIIRDKKIRIKLLSLKIIQLQNLQENLNLIESISKEIESLANESQYVDGLALYYAHMWYIEKLRGNKEKSKNALEISINLINKPENHDKFIECICKYIYATELWLEKHNERSAKIFEECYFYFYKNGFYRSFAHTIAILGIIYSRMQNGNKIIEKSKDIFLNKILFEKLPADVKAISYYFIGLGYMINMNLDTAESLFEEAYSILEPIHKKSIYFSNFIILHSYIANVKALQGKLEQTWKILQDVENLLEQDFFIKNLDLSTKNQIRHTINLNKFYVYSRLKTYNSDELTDLIQDIFRGSKHFYSDFMLLSEYILNSNLETTKLEELLSVNNFSINRVNHIISFVLQKDDSNNQQYLNKMKVLKNREINSKTTFIENVFADLLIAQQLFSLKRYGEIYPLLMKYENQLKRIEVLELCIFMEAFIQVGAFKSGDPLGPALQYMAIKKCRNYGFSRLEKKLLDYLDMQYKDIQTLKL